MAVELGPIGNALKAESDRNTRGSLKGAELAKLQLFSGSFDGIDLEFVGLRPIDGGIEVLARAWDSNGQIGFGKDGTVDIERFRIINPPILVPDGTQTLKTEGKLSVLVDNFVEDPQAALLQTVAHIVKVKTEKHGADRIVVGKVGSTTTQVFASAGDGRVGRGPGSGGTAQITWTLARDTADGEATDGGSASSFIMSDLETVADYTCSRAFFPFDTSSIPDTDVISSGILSVYLTVGSGSQAMGLVQTSQASTSSLAIEDFDTCGSVNSPTEGGSRSTSFSTNAYNDWTMNATGRGWIDKTGFTKLGLRYDLDIDNTTPTTPRNYVTFYFSEETGTTKDPAFTVEHAAAVGPANVKTYNGVTAANTKTINGVAIASVKTKNGVA